MTKRIIYSLSFILLVFWGCYKDPVAPENPFKKGSNGTTVPDTLNPSSIAGLHQNIFSVKCGNPSCHDGSFEPDFRTVQSAYSTLVFKEVKKNSSDLRFKWRVKPYDTTLSWLHERLTTGDSLLGRMPLYKPMLSRMEINQINKWIMEGAKDMNGLIPSEPDILPRVVYYGAWDLSEVQIDTNRTEYEAPFTVASNSTFYIRVVVEDDKTPVSGLSVNQLRFSTIKDDFSNPFKILTGTYQKFGAYEFYQFLVNAVDLPQSQNIFFRFYTNDNKHGSLDMEYPDNNSQIYIINHYSLKVQ